MDIFQESGGRTKNLVGKVIEPRSDQVVKYSSFVIGTLLNSGRLDYIVSFFPSFYSLPRGKNPSGWLFLLLVPGFLLPPGMRLSYRSWVSIWGLDYSWSLYFKPWWTVNVPKSDRYHKEGLTQAAQSQVGAEGWEQGQGTPDKSYSIFF